MLLNILYAIIFIGYIIFHTLVNQSSMGGPLCYLLYSNCKVLNVVELRV